MATDRADRDKVGPGEAAPTSEGFLRRWSRRKQLAGTAESDAALSGAKQDARGDGRLQQPEESVSPQAPLTDADMPPVESLDENSDYSDFFSDGVSDELRRLALRKLFHSAKFNIRDGLDDYDEDFTNFEKLGDVITADMRHHLEREAKKARERLLEGDGDEHGDALVASEPASSDEDHMASAIAQGTEPPDDSNDSGEKV